MKTIAMEDAKPGMRLGIDVRDAYGAVLLAAGSELSDSLLTALARRGISDISIVEQQPSLSQAEREALHEKTRARLAHLFRRAGQTSLDRQLFELVLDYRLEQLG